MLIALRSVGRELSTSCLLPASPKEREAFLAAARVGVLVVASSGEPPLALPMWYDYEPGGLISFITARDSSKAAAIRGAQQVGLCVHSDEYPYKYVSVWGPVTEIQETVTEADRRALARRYLGSHGGDRYVAERIDATPLMMIVRMGPERWLSQDQSR